MKRIGGHLLMAFLTVAGLAALGCRNHMPHAFTWPASGDTQYTHPKPPEGGYYSNWDPYAVELEVTPVEDVNPVRTQHYLIATVRDKDGKPLPNRRIEWIINDGSVGDIVEVDESGWRASRGYKVTNDFAVSHTNNFDHVLDMGNDDPSDDIHLTKGQSWCVITSPIEGDTYVTVYAPGIYDVSKHKVFVVKHWYDVRWDFPPPATNPIGTSHQFNTQVMQYSDNAPLAGYTVNYRIVDGPPAVLEPGGGQSASVSTDGAGVGSVTIRQTSPAEGTNNVEIEILRPENVACCKPGVKIATGMTSKTWIGPKIAIDKSAPAQAKANEQFNYQIVVSNPSQVDATNVVVTDSLPDGISYVSSSPSANVSGQNLSWSLGTVGPGGSQSISVTVKGSRTGTYENCADVRADYNLSARDCAPTVIVAPALAMEKRCPSEVTTCDPIDYVVVVRNTGDGPATNVRLEDRLPSGLQTRDGKTTVSGTIGDLMPGEAKEVRYTVNASQTGSYTNQASVTADDGLAAQATCTTVVKQPVLQVSKTGPDQRFIGRSATYEITVRNTGDHPANQTMLVDTLPAGMRFDRASDGGQVSGGTVTWNLGTIEPGGSRTVTVDLTATSAGSMRNTVRATAICAEGQAEVGTEVKGVPAILLEVIDVEDPIEVGTNTTYQIIVTNQGSAEGTNIRIECTLPAEMEFVNASGASQHTASGKSVSFAPVPMLAPRAQATWNVTVKGTAEGDVRFKTTLQSDQIGVPVEETEATRIY